MKDSLYLQLKSTWYQYGEQIENILRERLSEIGYMNAEDLAGKELESNTYPIHSYSSHIVTYATCTEYLIDGVMILKVISEMCTVSDGSTITIKNKVEKIYE